MSTPGLFAVGVVVTLIVAAALVPLIFAAIADGRYAQERMRAFEEPATEESADLQSDPRLAA